MARGALCVLLVAETWEQRAGRTPAVPACMLTQCPRWGALFSPHPVAPPSHRATPPSHRSLPVRRLASLAALLLFTSPSFAADPPVIKSAKSGSWSAVASWEGGAVPGAGARVLIREGHAITYDAKSDAVI